MKRRGKMKINEDILKAIFPIGRKYDRWKYNSTLGRIVTHKNGKQIVVTQLVGDPERLRVVGPALANKLNELRKV